MTLPTLRSAAIAAVTMWLLALSFPRDFSVGNYVDDAHYVVLAKSLRTRGAYRTLNLPGEPAETKYPPGFPAALAVTWDPDRSDAENLDRARWLNLAVAGLLAGSLTALAMDLLGMAPVAAVGLALAGLLMPRTAALWTVPLSGPLFLLTLTLGLYLVGTGRRGWGLATLVCSVYVRTVAGAFLLPALLLGWRARRRRWLEVGAVAGALVPWLLWQAVNGDAVPEQLRGLYGSYGRWYVDSLRADVATVLFRVPWQNALDALYELGGSLIGRGWLPRLALMAVGGVVVWAGVAARRVNASMALGMAVYGAIVLLWPFPPDRFVAGIWPLFLLMAAASVRERANLVALVVLCVAAVTVVRGEAVRFHQRRGAAADMVIARARPYLAPGDVLATTNPGRHYLELGVPAVPNQRMRSYRRYRLGYWSTAWGSADDVWPIIERYGVTTVAVEIRGVEGRYAVGSLQARCPGVVTPVWQSNLGAMLFRADAGAECAPPASGR